AARNKFAPRDKRAGHLTGDGGELDEDGFESVVNVDASAARGAGGFECEPGAFEDALGIVAFDAFGDANADRKARTGAIGVVRSQRGAEAAGDGFCVCDGSAGQKEGEAVALPAGDQVHLTNAQTSDLQGDSNGRLRIVSVRLTRDVKGIVKPDEHDGERCSAAPPFG